MQIDHTAVYVRNLEETKDFYTRYFEGRANEGYHNPKTGLRTYFLTFPGGGRLEIMHRPEMGDRTLGAYPLGYIHIAFKLGSKEKVDQLTNRLAGDGFTMVSGPRTTGDGYYESCVLDPEGNMVELMA